MSNGKDRGLDPRRAGMTRAPAPAVSVDAGGTSTLRCTLAGPGASRPTSWVPTLDGSAYVIDQNGNVFDPSDPLNPAHPVYRAAGRGFRLQDQSQRHAGLQRPGEFQAVRCRWNDIRCSRPPTSS